MKKNYLYSTLTLLLFTFFIFSTMQAQTYTVNLMGHFDKSGDTLYSYTIITKSTFPAFEKLKKNLGAPSKESTTRISWEDVYIDGVAENIILSVEGGSFIDKEKFGFEKSGKLPTQTGSKHLKEQEYEVLRISMLDENNKRIGNSQNNEQIQAWLERQVNY
jgi:hypothetical protein